MRFRVAPFFFFPLFLIAHEYSISLGKLGSIRYIHDDVHILEIERLSRDGEVMYSHKYNYNDQNLLVSETLIGNLGRIIYETPNRVKSPYHIEICEYDINHNLIRHTQDEIVHFYSYNNLNELISEETQEPYDYNLSGDLLTGALKR